MADEITDVTVSSPDGASTDVGQSSSPSVETSVAQTEQVAGGETATEGATEPEVSDPLEGLPSQEELEQQVAQNVPYAKALAQLRSAYEGVKPLKALESWKDVATQFSDPSEVIAQRDLIGKIHSPAPDGQSGFTTLPFLNDLEAQSPGTVHKLAMDSLGLEINLNGQTDTLIRHLFRGYGLDPDRLEDYKEIDSRAPAGVITPDQLVGIDQKYHAAFKALSQAQREDILLQRDRETGEFPAAVMDYLQDKSEALEARQWREQVEQQRQQEAQAKQQEFEQGTVKAVDEDISTVRREMYDAIHQHLASQLKLSSDEVASDSKYDLVLGTLGSLFYPEMRFSAEKALERVGTPLDPKFDQIVNTFAAAREKYVRFTRQGDQLQARGALSEANLAKAILRTKLGDYALALAGNTANRLQSQSQQLQTSLQGATARVVPSGTVQPASSSGNPYMENPHQFGSSEYLAYNKRLDKELGVGGAAALAR